MNKFSTLIFFGALTAAMMSGFIGTTEGAQCVANYEQAAAQSPRDGYIVFAYAEGWDKFSKALCQDLMKNPLILKGAGSAMLIPMPVYECPTTEQAEAQKVLMGKLGVKEALSYPAVFMFDAEGRHYATICGPEMVNADAKQLSAMLGKRIAAMHEQNKLLDAAKTAVGVEKAKLLGAASRVEEINAPSDILKQIKAADPKDESGFVRSVGFQPWVYTEDLLKRKLDDTTLKGLEGKPDKDVQQKRLELEMILKELDSKLSDPAFTNEQKQVFCANAIGTLHRKGDVTDGDRIRKYAKLMHKLGPETTLGQSAPIVVKAWVKALTLEEGWQPNNLPMGNTPVELKGRLPIREPGVYLVTFTYQSGTHALKIKEVRLNDGEAQIAVDAHPGSTGTPQNTKGNTYRLNVDKTVNNPRLFIIFDMPKDRHSFGTISITRE